MLALEHNLLCPPPRSTSSSGSYMLGLMLLRLETFTNWLEIMQAMKIDVKAGIVFRSNTLRDIPTLSVTGPKTANAFRTLTTIFS